MFQDIMELFFIGIFWVESIVKIIEIIHVSGHTGTFLLEYFELRA